jgi:hypothetical protein
VRPLRDASSQPAQAGASAASSAGWAHHREGVFVAGHEFSFAQLEPVHGLVHPSSFVNPTEAPVQIPLPLLQRIDGPAVVPATTLQLAKTYREAVRLCWALRRAKGLTPSDMARDFGFVRQHVGDYLNADDKPSRRSLPAEQIGLFQEICGNCAIIQWLAARDRLTVLEQVQADVRAAA